MKTSSRALLVGSLVVLSILALIGTPAGARLWVELRWFEQLGHADVLWTPLWARLGLGALAGALAFGAMLVSLRLAVRFSKAGRRTPIYFGETAVEVDLTKAAAKLALPVSIAAGVIGAIVGSASWREWLLFRNGSSFGEVDPVFGRDVGFYVFTLPFLDRLQGFVTTLALAVLALTALMYVGRAALGVQQGTPRATSPARMHLAVLGAITFATLAFGAWLSSASLVISQDGLVAGAGYADIHARLPAIRIHLATALVAGAALLLGAFRQRSSFALVGVGAYLVVGVIGRMLVPAVVQTYIVEPNELERERPYIEHEITATRAAYGLDGLTTRELSGDFALSAEHVDANHDTIDNIRVWDHSPLLQTFGQIQEIRTYYDFESVDNDRYVIDGALRQTMLSPRELSSASLPNRTWINEHFTFTHGYGLTLGPVNEADDEGLPRLFVQDIPPVTDRPELEVSRPEIYFGELSNDYVFVGTANREFDHPSAEGNVYSPYEGEAGVTVEGTLFRTALSLYFGNFKIMLSDDLSDDSRVLMHREVRDRVRRLAPFLQLDDDPYLVVRENGTLAWVVDAYTATSRFPYSRAADTQTVRGNYVRNSVKAIVDAYDGTVTLYVADPDDPILATWQRIFDGLFTPMDEMPEDLRAHLRAPLDLFHVQAETLATFHMDSPELLYNREDQWSIPALEGAPMEPYYTVMRLPGEPDPEFILMLPFTPARKDNLAAWMVARNDGDALGELVVYRFPNDRLVYGPQQVQNRINQDAHISQQLSLWDQRGSQADFGTLLVIPVEESLLYVLPLYLRSEGGSIPQLKRVIVVYENHIAMAQTLDLALASIFGGSEDAPPAAAAVATSPTDPDALAGPRAILERALAAQRSGDWAGYGEAIEELRQALGALPDAATEGTEEEPTESEVAPVPTEDPDAASDTE